MPSQRRARIYFFALVLIFSITAYVRVGGRKTEISDFYTKTQEALQAKEYAEAAKERDAFSVKERLNAAEEAAKKAADDKERRYHEAVEGDSKGGSVAGRVKLSNGEKGGKEGEKKVQGVATVGGKVRDIEASQGEKESPEEHEVEVELNLILKKSPVIIFSKSYCPYSAKAKSILLSTYKILPEPYVVELDLHPLGPQLQATLKGMTHRGTVPNILVQGRSIGGGDDIQELHESGKLVDTIREFGGTRIAEAVLREDEDGERRRRRRRRV